MNVPQLFPHRQHWQVWASFSEWAALTAGGWMEMQLNAPDALKSKSSGDHTGALD